MLFFLGETILLCDSDDEAEIDTVKKTNNTLRSIVQSDETIRHHWKIKKSTTFIRTFRTFYQRISNGFRRKSPVFYPTVRREISLEHGESHENLYETIPWELYNSSDIVAITELNEFCTIRRIRRSPPQITWKHSWTTSETRDALLNSSFSNIPNEIYLQIFQFFSIRDLGNVSLVCRQFKIIADDDQIWKSKCKSKFKFVLLFFLSLILM
jgi:hypothetical protein